jgi:hypothetical protein
MKINSNRKLTSDEFDIYQEQQFQKAAQKLSKRKTFDCVDFQTGKIYRVKKDGVIKQKPASAVRIKRKKNIKVAAALKRLAEILEKQSLTAECEKNDG